ncbi:MAG TPA: hypothetical protein DIC42_00240 [Holosporales bacterium]|nr:hypothetical protein [Holosporales bacterium]
MKSTGNPKEPFFWEIFSCSFVFAHGLMTVTNGVHWLLCDKKERKSKYEKKFFNPLSGLARLQQQNTYTCR